MASTPQTTPKLLDDRLVAALSHETRAHALMVFTERAASTKEIAAELGQSVSAVWYHVDRLDQLGCIEQVEKKKRRGAQERFFRATVRHFFDAESWGQLPRKDRQSILMGILRLISSDLDEAVRADTLDTIDNHVSRTLLQVDEEGWEEVNAHLDRSQEELFEIRERSNARRKKDQETLRVSVSMLSFQIPQPEPA